VPSDPNGAKRQIRSSFGGLKGKILQVEADEAISVSTAVSVHHEDVLFLGEIITCQQIDGLWHMEIKVEQMLTGLQSLMALRSSLLNEGVPQPFGLVPVGSRN